jgi:hypothetical protein
MDMKNISGHISYTTTHLFNILQFIMDVLIDQFEPKQTGRFRDIMNADDVVYFLHHH